MNSFFFWLTSAAALGALLGLILRPGPIEIAIVLVVLNAIYYGRRKLIQEARRGSPA